MGDGAKFLPVDSPHQMSIAPTESQFLSNNPIRTSFFALIIDPVPFFILISYSFCTQVRLSLTLVDVQWLQNVVF